MYIPTSASSVVRVPQASRTIGMHVLCIVCQAQQCCAITMPTLYSRVTHSLSEIKKKKPSAQPVRCPMFKQGNGQTEVCLSSFQPNRGVGKTRPREVPAGAPILTRWQDAYSPCRAHPFFFFFRTSCGADGTWRRRVHKDPPFDYN